MSYEYGVFSMYNSLTRTPMFIESSLLIINELGILQKNIYVTH
jgi:hypothetical protein